MVMNHTSLTDVIRLVVIGQYDRRLSIIAELLPLLQQDHLSWILIAAAAAAAAVVIIVVVIDIFSTSA